MSIGHKTWAFFSKNDGIDSQLKKSFLLVFVPFTRLYSLYYFAKVQLY